MAKCWHCGVEQGELSSGQKLSFRAICDKCGAWLHCCKNCVNYKPGLPNDCLIPGTDLISDREASNFCEEFVLKGAGLEKKKSISDASLRLFGEDDQPSPKNPKDKFGSLFND